ncbi:MAG TPA: PQQ-dependent sugar dehydrogenase, partial [Polyangiaceae bacterium]|nr:PQQ-dependent sugar dehydrogenase [Polyangiaceae bacterium]
SAEIVVSGLEVPWGLAFLAPDEFLVTERPGRLRRVVNGELDSAPLATLPIAETAEGGLLDIALHPDFADNRRFYLYVTAASGDTTHNQVELWTLAEDHRSAAFESVVFGGIPAASVHDGGRISVGLVGMLYVTTGDAREPDDAQDLATLSGKILRLTPEGEPAPDNPWPGSAAVVLGVRNPQGLVLRADGSMVIADHGPSGELGREGHDEISVAAPGANLGWPTIYGCEARAGLVTPIISWQQATPPGGMALYDGGRISEWQGALVVGTLRSEHLHVLHLDESGLLARHETYFERELGRLRTVLQGPDGELYVTTSNCDGRGECGATKDAVLRLVRRQD